MLGLGAGPLAQVLAATRIASPMGAAMTPSSPEQRSEVQIGDRVLLKTDHPWAHFAGVVIAPFIPSTLVPSGWTVRLDSGHECYARNDELTVLR
jgi:hypothetical protein